jgi:hypothetical protein
MTGWTEKLHHDEPVPSKQAARLFNSPPLPPSFDARRRVVLLQWRKIVLSEIMAYPQYRASSVVPTLSFLTPRPQRQAKTAKEVSEISDSLRTLRFLAAFALKREAVTLREALAMGRMSRIAC